jgi:transposase InsO family protein
MLAGGSVYRRLFVLLLNPGEPSALNRIYRLYREEGLTVRKRRARRRAVGTRAPILVEARLNACWSLDFVHDQFAKRAYLLAVYLCPLLATVFFHLPKFSL